MLLVGLTGGIGSGKSTVSEGLVRRGAVLIDGDRIAREVVEPGGPAYAGLVERFGRSVLGDDDRLDRPALASLVFADPAALADLNAITHPAIATAMLEQVVAQADGDRIVVLDIPLLKAEAVSGYGLRAVLVVDTPEEAAIERLVADRGFSEADARARVAAQIGRSERRAFADFVIDNSGDHEALEREIDRAWRWLESLQAGG